MFPLLAGRAATRADVIIGGAAGDEDSPHDQPKTARKDGDQKMQDVVR
jgi:hypothetical protein